MKRVVEEIIGYYGLVAILLAYFLISFKFIEPVHLLHYTLNLTGAAGIIYISWTKRAYQPAVLNIIWGLIALIGIIRGIL